MGWREYAQTVRDSGHDRHSRHNRSDQEAIVPNVPIVLGLPSEETARSILAEWHRRLSALDVYEVPEVFEQQRWGMLVHDSWFIYETHASRLVRDGWTAIDLFAVVPLQRGIGGLADRLQGARNVLFDDQGKAHWTRLGVKFSLSKGIGEALRGTHSRLVWD